jgi:hypothetical protein
MKAFAALYQRLDRSTATLDKRAALVDYFRHARPHDAAWALFLLSGGKVGGARAPARAWGARGRAPYPSSPPLTSRPPPLRPTPLSPPLSL